MKKKEKEKEKKGGGEGGGGGEGEEGGGEEGGKNHGVTIFFFFLFFFLLLLLLSLSFPPSPCHLPIFLKKTERKTPTARVCACASLLCAQCWRIPPPKMQGLFLKSSWRSSISVGDLPLSLLPRIASSLGSVSHPRDCPILYLAPFQQLIKDRFPSHVWHRGDLERTMRLFGTTGRSQSQPQSQSQSEQQPTPAIEKTKPTQEHIMYWLSRFRAGTVVHSKVSTLLPLFLPLGGLHSLFFRSPLP